MRFFILFILILKKTIKNDIYIVECWKENIFGGYGFTTLAIFEIYRNSSSNFSLKLISQIKIHQNISQNNLEISYDEYLKLKDESIDKLSKFNEAEIKHILFYSIHSYFEHFYIVLITGYELFWISKSNKNELIILLRIVSYII